jgi:lipid-A-disaccharide synthase
MSAQKPRLFLIAAEESGDRLGARLMRVITRRRADVVFAGLGGPDMAAEGLVSLFPIEQLSIIGVAAVAKALPTLLRRIGEAAQAAIASGADALVIIDSPDFSHRVARKVRAAKPQMPIINYVSPTVWAWRPGRAKAMRHYVDHVLALLPFEPQAHRDLGGPPCTYVGHPLTEQLASLRPNAEEAARRAAEPPVLLVLPGSRGAEIRYHMPIFGETLRLIREAGTACDVILPTTAHLAARVAEAATHWPVQPRIVQTEDEKRAAFRIAHAALAKSGTVTLELALAQVPMIAAYRMSPLERLVARHLVTAHSAILANLVLGENVIPEYLLAECTPQKLAPALREVMFETPMRQRQRNAFARLDAIMIPDDRAPSEKAADIVLRFVDEGRAARP